MTRRRVPTLAELDITPMMSLVMHLIPMLLLVIQFVSFAGVAAGGPVIPARPAGAPGELTLQEAEVVSVLVTGQGFVVGGAGRAEPRIPCAGTCAADTYDYAGLNAAMVAAKRLHPTETRVVIAPEPAIPYDVLIRVMDATRARRVGATEEPLFPAPLLAAGAAPRGGP